MDTQKFIYAGNPDYPKQWEFIPDTDEARYKAIEKGYLAFSTMSFDYEPENNKPQPTRYGSLWLDIDCKGDPKKAIAIARSVSMTFYRRYFVDLLSFRYFLSGGKGCTSRFLLYRYYPLLRRQRKTSPCSKHSTS